MKFKLMDLKMLGIVVVGVVIAGLILNAGDNAPILEDAHNGFGG